VLAVTKLNGEGTRMLFRSIALAIVGALALASCGNNAEKMGPGDWAAIKAGGKNPGA
jgi:hypothetical protein